jgi:hypothetical protein
MKDVGKLKSYSIGPDKLNVGDHICRLTLEIKAGPGSLPELARSCGDLIGEEVGISLTRIQGKLLNVKTGEVEG